MAPNLGSLVDFLVAQFNILLCEPYLDMTDGAKEYSYMNNGNSNKMIFQKRAQGQTAVTSLALKMGKLLQRLTAD